MNQPIRGFQGPYRFLSNFWPAPVTWCGLIMPTVEHAYQAAKCEHWADTVRFASLREPAQAKALGRAVNLRPDWTDALKLAIMHDLLRQKFQHPELARALEVTAGAELVEWNTWGDRFWGVCGWQGENHLGRLLMAVRAERRGLCYA